MITSAADTPSPGEYRSECRARHPVQRQSYRVNGDDNFFTVTRERFVDSVTTTSNTMWCRPVPSSVSPIYYPGAYAPHPALSGL